MYKKVEMKNILHHLLWEYIWTANSKKINCQILTQKIQTKKYE